MSLTSHQVQAAIARRREMEHMRVERTAALNRYYDHWGKVNSRYETWTTPEYYKNAEEQLKQNKEKKEKEQNLEDRREVLRKLLVTEKKSYETEISNKERNRFRKAEAKVETLEKINQNLKERENIRRKLELESKLYGRWRHGVDDENAIFNSKTDNEVLAKLNWLDKQVDNQLQREREEAIAQERNLRLQEEISKTEQAQKERQQIREAEIKEIRELQERHMEELKDRQAESDKLKEEENKLRHNLDELDRELELLEECSVAIAEPTDLSPAYNVRKIKVFLRKRSEDFRNHIKTAINMLERIRAYTTKPEMVNCLIQKYKNQYETESYAIGQIEAMYESEAKFNLQRCEDAWQTQNLERLREIKQAINSEQCIFSTRINENLERQSDVIKIRSTHLSSIEGLNDKLNALIKEQEESPRNYAANASNDFPTTASAAASASAFAAENAGSRIPSNTSIPVSNRASNDLSKVSDSFTNLNLDVWQNMEGQPDKAQLQQFRSQQSVRLDPVERPKFARKRVAWT